MQDSSCGNDAAVQMVNAEAFQRLHLEVFVELLLCGLFGKHPIIQFEGTESCTEIAFKVMAAFTVVEHLLGLERTNQLFHIVVGTLAHKEFAGRDIQEANSASRLSEMHGCEEVVLLVVQHIVLHRHARSHQFGDASLHKFLGQFRVFQLVADGDTFAGTNQFGKIGV